MTRPDRRSERGASALELSFLAPGLIFLIFLSIQAGLFFYGRAVAIQAAREGVSQLRLAPDRPSYETIRERVAGNVERYALSVGNEALLRPQAWSSYDDAAGRVRVEVTGTVITLVPGLDLGVRAAAEGPVERFEPGALP